MSTKTNSFIFLPLPVLKDLLLYSKTINYLYDLGIYFSSKRIEIKQNAALTDFMYCVYRHKELLPKDLYDECINIKDFPYDDKKYAFTYDGFDPFYEIAYLEIHGKKFPDFLDRIMEWHRVRQMYHLLNLKIETSLQTLQNAKTLIEHYKLKTSSMVYILVNGEVMLNLYKQAPKMTVDERAVWAMYFGIISILGQKDYVQTTSDLIKCRMFGAKNKEELEEVFRGNLQRKKLYNKFTSKYQYNKILNIIQDRGMIRELAHKRRTYLSFKARNVTELMNMIIEKEQNSKRKVRDEEKKKAQEMYYKIMNQPAVAETIPEPQNVPITNPVVVPEPVAKPIPAPEPMTVSKPMTVAEPIVNANVDNGFEDDIPF